MSVREYIGARYVPMFADPIEWDSTLVYEPLTVVQYQGGSYVSRREVPAGIELTNTDYWILWADFNAQLQHYIDIVNTFDSRIDTLEDELPTSAFDSTNTVDARFDAIGALLPTSAFDSTNTIDARFDANESDIDALEGKFPIVANDISDNTITYQKLNSNLKNMIDKNNTTKMLIISDSYASHSSNLQFTATWPAKVAASLGLTLTNLSNPGDGFVQNNGFLTQLATALNLTDKEQYGIIIVYGGVNDVNNNANAATFRTNATNIINSLNTNFPNAMIYLCGINAGISNFNSDANQKKLNTYREILRNIPINYKNCVYIDTTLWLLCGENMYAADKLHPHDTNGNIALAYSFINMLHGIDEPFFTIEEPVNLSTTDTNELALQTVLNKPYKICNGKAYIPSSVSNLITLANPTITSTIKTLPGIPGSMMEAREGILGFAFKASNSAVYPILFSINDGGVVVAFPENMPSASGTYRIFVPTINLTIAS